MLPYPEVQQTKLAMPDQATTSVRIVSVDHYMSKPDRQFDVCYSEFRGAEVRQVPVIRLFGTTTDGRHSCVHIHGVFPYFYIPYEGSTTDRLAIDKRVYQLASALDKAINVSLARPLSRASHVFKIVLVKGIPIYGYHNSEHNYLKIYMYNPLLVRNATQLLMNGAIPSAMPQVHETHIPYVLQFFIDYNLYGMSFLHLNATGLRQRMGFSDNAAEIPPKMSTSEYEIDAFASEILNREPDQGDDGEFANPGIASIWKDEQTRRRLLGMEQPDSMNLSQVGSLEREVVTESDRFYRALLSSKLSKDQTRTAENRESAMSSGYPTEATKGVLTLDASSIVHHRRSVGGGHSNESLYASQISYHFDASIEIDEQKIMSMSQGIDATLQEEDYNLLEIMRELEENEKNNFEGDCLLAPLTQQGGRNNNGIVQGCITGGSQPNKRLNASMCGDLEAICLMNLLENEGQEHGNSFDSDDELFMDLTQKQNNVSNDALDRSNESLKDSCDGDLLAGGSIPQLDGADDSFVPHTPKRTRKRIEVIPHISPLAKRVCVDLNEPATRRTITPRRVTFAPSPSIADSDERAKRIRKQFEESSPNTLKNIEIRVPKLSLVNKSMLFKRSTTNNQKRQDTRDIPLKNVCVRVTKLDANACKGHKHPVNRQSYDYDKLNNFNPLEGTSTQTSNRVRKTDELKKYNGKSKAKRLKLQEKQEIEVLLSERFKNIIRLSPKVLIKPLVNDCESSVSKYTQNRELVGSIWPGEAILNKPISSNDNPPVFDMVISDDAECDKLPEKEELPVAQRKQIESSEASPNNIAEVEEIESESNKNTCEIRQRHENSDVTATDAITIRERITVRSIDTEKIFTVDITDDDSIESVPISVSESLEMVEPLIVIDIDCIDKTPKLSEPSPAISNEQINDLSQQQFAINNHSPSEKCTDVNTIPTVPIGSQLDGTGEPMEEGNAEEEVQNESGDYTHIYSFCETTMVCEVDEIESDSDESSRGALNAESEKEKNEIRIIISLAARPPTREQAHQAIKSFEIPKVVNSTPFYSDPADITGKTEVGHTVLHIPGNSINDLEEYKSEIAGLRSMKHLRYAILQQTYGESLDEVLGPVDSNRPLNDRMMELLTSECLAIIALSEGPPSRAQADTWINERTSHLQTDPAGFSAKGRNGEEQDSPIKVKKADAIMTIEENVESSPLAVAKQKGDSTLNLSALLMNDECISKSKTDSTRNLVAKIMTMNTYGSPKPQRTNFNRNEPEITETSVFTKAIDSSPSREKKQHAALHESQAVDERINTLQIDKEHHGPADVLSEAIPHEPAKVGTCEQVDENPATSPCVTASSDQSDLIEQSNSNISIITPHDNTYDCKLTFKNHQHGKAGCEV